MSDDFPLPTPSLTSAVATSPTEITATWPPYVADGWNDVGGDLHVTAPDSSSLGNTVTTEELLAGTKTVPSTSPSGSRVVLQAYGYGLTKEGGVDDHFQAYNGSLRYSPQSNELVVGETATAATLDAATTTASPTHGHGKGHK